MEPIGRISPASRACGTTSRRRRFAALLKGFRTYSPARFGIQLAHAGRKASTHAPWIDRGSPLKPEEGAWTTAAPSPIPFAEGWPTPEALDEAGLKRVREAFAQAAVRADRAGFDAGGAARRPRLSAERVPLAAGEPPQRRLWRLLQNRMRFPLEVTEAVRAVWPRTKALGVRLNGSDWAEGGITPDEAAASAAS